MKKLFLLMAFAMMSILTYADGLTATLQQGENMQAFYGDSAFVKAYEAAQDGDVITLSIGDSFVGTESITKSITIIGAGGCTGSSSYRTNLGNLRVNANSVKLEGIYAICVTLGQISDCHIKRCYFDKLEASETHVNTLIEQSVIKSDYAIGTGVNYTLKNSTLESFYTMNTSENKATIINCVIWYWGKYGNSSIKQPYAIYISNIIGGVREGYYAYEIPLSALSEYYYNTFIHTGKGSGYYIKLTFPEDCKNEGNGGVSNNSVSYPSELKYKSSTGIGIDGTVCGTYGGAGFNAQSSIPRITEITIPSYADEQGKINVTISATTGPN